MTDYRRIYIPGLSWFFTVNLAERRNNHLLVEQIDHGCGTNHLTTCKESSVGLNKTTQA